MTYIWELDDWPAMTWNSDILLPLLGRARFAQGAFLSRIQRVGFDLAQEARATVLMEEAIKTSAIEGESLNKRDVRSSVARCLGLSDFGLCSDNRSVDGLVSVLFDATHKYSDPLTCAKLQGWHAALFPTGYSGFYKLTTGDWRGDSPMRIVSGPIGREKVYFEAPPSARLPQEIDVFLSWWQSSEGVLDGLLRAGLAHLYFVVIHPFEDGNGRISRALMDMALAQDEKLGVRYYSMSSQIMADRLSYYRALESASNATDLDVTAWLVWFLSCYQRALDKSDALIRSVLLRSDFWQRHAQTSMNDRQKKVLNRLLDVGEGQFEGGLTTRKYLGLTKVSRATAFREITDLVAKGLLVQNSPKGRSVSYDINWHE
jgi:Fic family protein